MAIIVEGECEMTKKDNESKKKKIKQPERKQEQVVQSSGASLGGILEIFQIRIRSFKNSNLETEIKGIASRSQTNHSELVDLRFRIVRYVARGIPKDVISSTSLALSAIKRDIIRQNVQALPKGQT